MTLSVEGGGGEGKRREENGKQKTNELSSFIFKLAYQEPSGTETGNRRSKACRRSPGPRFSAGPEITRLFCFRPEINKNNPEPLL